MKTARRRPATVWRRWLQNQPPLQIAVLLAAMFLAVVVFLDEPFLHFSRASQPGIRAVMMKLMLWGDSNWSLLISATLIGLLSLAMTKAGWHDRPLLRLARGQALFLFTAISLTGISVSFMKNLIGRARPGALDPSQVLVFHPGDFSWRFASFPSGHSTTALALAVALGLLAPRYRTMFLVIGCWAALGRAMVGAHWLSDVIAGAMWGSVGVWLIANRFAARGIGFRRNGKPAPPLRRTGVALCRTLWVGPTRTKIDAERWRHTLAQHLQRYWTRLRR